LFSGNKNARKSITPFFNTLLHAKMVRLRQTQLPSPEIIIEAKNNIVGAFDDVVQVEILKTRLQEINSLQNNLNIVYNGR
jgi:hypothetical protein